MNATTDADSHVEQLSFEGWARNQRREHEEGRSVAHAQVDPDFDRQWTVTLADMEAARQDLTGVHVVQ